MALQWMMQRKAQALLTSRTLEPKWLRCMFRIVVHHVSGIFPAWFGYNSERFGHEFQRFGLGVAMIRTCFGHGLDCMGMFGGQLKKYTSQSSLQPANDTTTNKSKLGIQIKH